MKSKILAFLFFGAAIAAYNVFPSDFVRNPVMYVIGKLFSAFFG